MNPMAQRPAPTTAAGYGGLRQWIAASCLAFALHAGAAAMLLVGEGKADSDDNFGAIAMEVGIEDAAPSFDSTGEPADIDAAVAAAAPSETAAALPEPASAAITDKSEAEEQTTAAPHEQAEQLKKEVGVTASSTVAPSASAGAPSRATEQESVQSVTATIGSSADAQRVQATWRRGLVAHIERQKRYPAHGAEQSAYIVVRFTINRQGRLTEVEIAKGSGDARFDQAALEMIRRADPLPAPPSVVADQNLSFRIPISFRPGG